MRNATKNRLHFLFFLVVSSIGFFLTPSYLYAQEADLDGRPRNIAAHPGSNTGIATHKFSDVLTLFQLDNIFVQTPVSVGESTYDVAVNNTTGLAYFTKERSDAVGILNLSTQSITGSISVGGSPHGIAVHEGLNLAVVANSKTDNVSIIDLSTNAVTDTINVGVDPEDVAINSSSNLAYITNRGSDTVTVIDLNTKTITTTVNVGSAPMGIALRPSSNRAVVANQISDNVSIIDTGTHAVIATVSVGSAPTGVAIHDSDNKAYISNNLSDNVSVIDLGTETVILSSPVKRNPVGVMIVPGVWEDHLYVVSQESDKFLRINVDFLSDDPANPQGEDSEGITIDQEDGTAIGAMYKLDAITTRNGCCAFGGTSVGEGPRDVAFHQQDDKILTADYRGDTATIIALAGTYTVPVGSRPISAAVDPVLNRGVIANEQDGTLSLIDLDTHTVTATIPSGPHPADIAVDSITHQAVVANPKADTVTVVDLANQIILGTVPVGQDPVSVAVNPNTGQAVAVNNKSETLSVIDLNTRTVVATVSVPGYASGVAINPSTNVAVVVLQQEQLLQPVDLTTLTLQTPIAVEHGSYDPYPVQIAIIHKTNIAAVNVNPINDPILFYQLENPVPSLDEIIPEAVGVGDPAFTLTLNGSKFLETSTVDFGTETYTPQFISNEQLQVDIPASELTNIATIEVSVTNPAPAGGTSNVLVFAVEGPPPTITAITPDSAVAGSGGFILAVDGTDFVPESVVHFDGQPQPTTYVSDIQLTANIPASAIAVAGEYPVVVVNPSPWGGASNALTFTVNGQAPVISSLSPDSGPVGTAVTIEGQNFDPIAANNQVDFNGTDAIITTATTTAITTTVPQGATTGSVTVTTPQGTAVSPQPFTVTPSREFDLIAVPAQATTLQGGQVSYALSAIGIGDFTGLVSLQVTDLPADVTPEFSSTNLAPGQSGTLTLNVDPSASLGLFPFTLTGTAMLETGPQSQEVPLTLEVIGGGQTSLASRFITVDGEPILGVQVQIDTVQAQTDAAGNFLLNNVPSDTQPLMVDANAAQPGYPIYAMDVTLTENVANILPAFQITPPPPPERFTPFDNATADQIITDPRYPGVEITLPAGSSIIGWDGVPKTQVAIERLSPLKLPVPPPPGATRSLYQLFFGTPIGGVPTEPLPVTGPNDLGLDPGEQAELWYFDATPMGGEPAGWRYAGTGTVSNDGTQIVSDPGVGIERFCGVCGLFCWFVNQNRDPYLKPLGGPKVGDPVDLSIGHMIVEKTDMVLPGRFPVTISRTYNPFDPFDNIAGFTLSLGLGWALSVDSVLLPINNDMIRLVLPGNARVDFSRQADGTFTNERHPTMNGAVLSTVGADEHQIRFKDGTVWRFKSLFLGQELLIEMTDRNGNQVSIERSGANIQRIVDSAGRVLEFTYSGPRLTQIRDPLGRTVQYTYNADDRLQTVTDPAGGVTSYDYDSEGRITAITDARDITYLTNEYDAGGRLMRQTQVDGAVYEFEYEVSGNHVLQAIATDPEGNKTTYRFNNRSYTTEIVDALGQVTRFERDANNQLIATTNPLGRETTYTYDTDGNVTSITDPDDNVTLFEYDPAFNRVTKITDAQNNVTQFVYDANGNLTETIDPLLNSTTIAYNTFGQPLSVTDPLNNVTQFEYDGFGNLVKTIDPLGNTTQRAYDLASRLISLTDPQGRSTQFGYDDLNRVVQITDALNGLTAFSYDANGNLLTVTDARDETTTYTYDSMDRLETRTDPLSRQESYTYDLNGSLETFTDRKLQVSTFTYDALNRRTAAQYADGSDTAFVYDAAGRLIQASDSLSGSIDLTYDNLDRLVSEITPQGIVNYAYDAIGRRTAMTANGQAPVTYGYDDASRLIEVAQGPQQVGIGYDIAGRRTSLTYPNGASTDYFYDAASRLTEILHQGPGGVIEDLLYSYDAAGNRISFSRTGPQADLPDPVQAAYDAANQQVEFNPINPGAPNLTYDANGNLTSHTEAAGTTNYTWDARNRLTAISGPSISASFVYDALSRRVSKTINGVTTQYLYDGNDIISEISGGSVGVTYLRSLNIDEPFIRQGSDNEYYHADALGSVIGLSDDAGVIQTTYRHEPFGKTTLMGTSDNPFGFSGREIEMDMGLYYLRARYYSPLLKRFISEDLLRVAINLYTYVGNRPTLAIDPFGLYSVAIRGGFGDAPVGPSGSGDSMQTIANDLGSAGEQVVVYGPGNTAAALADLQAHQNDPTGANVVCHSRGCDQILNQLNQNGNVQVDRMVILDCYGFSGSCGTIPDNVGRNLNYWQDGFLGGGENRRGNGSGAGITNVQVPLTHSQIPGNPGVQDGTRACILNGQCGGTGVVGGRK